MNKNRAEISDPSMEIVPSSPLNLFVSITFIFCLTFSAKAQNYQNISSGSFLTTQGPNTSWLSPSGDFAFGFHPLVSDPNQFLLAIWFAKTSNRTVVWYAKDNNLVKVGLGSRVDLTTDGGLSLKNETGPEVWSSGTSGVAYAALLDTGNFVLVGTDGSTQWQSFSYPTDTILPGQVLQAQQDLKLLSKLTDDDFSDGRFSLRMQRDGNLVLYVMALPFGTQNGPYWASNTVGNGTQLVFNSSGTIDLFLKIGGKMTMISEGGISTDNAYQRATLDPDGAFRYYVYAKNGTSWQAIDALPKDVCLAGGGVDTGSGICGFNSYCISSADSINQRADCECPPHYSFIDPNRTYKGCKPDFVPQSCDSDGTDVSFATVTDLQWLLANYEVYSTVNEDQCRQQCSSDCFCAVAIFSNDGTCRMKKFPLTNGRMGGSTDSKAFIKFSTGNNSDPQLPPNSADVLYLSKDRKDGRTLILVGSLLLGSFVIVSIIAISMITFCSFGLKKKEIQPAKSMSSISLKPYTYKELQEVTNGFDEEVGRGGFGIVYKGSLEEDQRTYVAVKKLDTHFQETRKEFVNEVQSIGQTYHKNLVKLLGYCDEGNEKLLVYEFMSNGSLTDYLFHNERPKWNNRSQIALDVARGLLYLHDELSRPIIHCDIKPGNVLLDDNLVARISDFGLAKLLRTDQSRTNTGARGTKGYVAPDWFKNTSITTKVDVFSFGVLLLEIVCCRRNVEKENEDEEQTILTYWAYDCYTEGRLDLLVENDEEAKIDIERVQRFVTVAIWCIQEDPLLRPSMRKVVQMLEGAIVIPEPPNPSGDTHTMSITY